MKMRWKMLGRRLRRYGLFLAIALLAISIQPHLALSAEEAAQDSKGSAVIIVIPEGLADAERQSLVEDVLKAQGSGASATNNEAAEEAAFLTRVGSDLRKVRQVIETSLLSIDQIPQILALAIHAMAPRDSTGGGFLAAMFMLLTIFGGAAAAEAAFRRLVWKAAPAPEGNQAKSLSERLARTCGWMVRECVALVFFGVIAVCLFFLLHDDHEKQRLAAAYVISAVILARFASLATRFILAPGRGAQRLVPLTDEEAQAVYLRLQALVVFIIFVAFTQGLAIELEAPWQAVLAFGIAGGVIIVALEIAVVLQLRGPIRELILRGGEEEQTASRARVLVARNWHIYVIGFFVAIFLVAIHQRATGSGGSQAPAALGTMALVVILPLAIRAIQQLLAEAIARREQEGLLPVSSLRRNCQIAIARIIPVLMILAAITGVGLLWGINIFSLSRQGFGEQIFDAIIDIGLILILAYFLWELIRSLVDQRMHDEDPELDDHESEEGGLAASRLSTLLPLIRTTLFIVLTISVIFVVLSELGFNIGPLLAGAGVVGIAVGFGAQALVADIISGVFFLIDDAFRKGEYIDVGAAKGVVEKISIRSLQLRHQNGPVHTVPFGQIQTLTNYSRDWAIIKFEVRVPFETDINQVRKIVKNIGIEMMADEELGKMMLAPLKSQGVNRMDDSALIIRCKFTAVPGKQFLVRREAFTRIQEAFAQAGIKFAPRRVVVDAPSPELAKAATAALADEESQSAAKPAAGPDG